MIYSIVLNISTWFIDNIIFAEPIYKKKHEKNFKYDVRNDILTTDAHATSGQSSNHQQEVDEAIANHAAQFLSWSSLVSPYIQIKRALLGYVLLGYLCTCEINILRLQCNYHHHHHNHHAYIIIILLLFYHHYLHSDANNRWHLAKNCRLLLPQWGLYIDTESSR